MTAPAEPVDNLDWNLDFDGPWGPHAIARYRNGGCTGLALHGRRGAPDDLEFLFKLPGLRSLEIRAPIADDTAAFRLSTLEKLVLATGSRRRIPRETLQPNIRRLVLQWRPGVDVGGFWPSVESLRIPPRVDHCRWLGGAQMLRSLQLEGQRKHASLDGIEGSPRLQVLKTTSLPLRATSPLAGLVHLQQVRLLSLPPAPSHALVDLAHLAGAPLRELWISAPQELRGLDSLGAHDQLGEIRLIGYEPTTAEQKIIEQRRLRVRSD